MAMTNEPGLESNEDNKLLDPASPKSFKSKAARCRTKRRELIRQWETNIDMRRGKPSEYDDDDEQRMDVPVDWSQSKAKIVQLFSQLPRVVVSGRGIFQKAAPSFEEHLNFRIEKGHMGAAMFECMPDLVNAAGITAAIALYEARTEMRTVPKIPDAELSLPDRIAYRLGLKQREMEEQPFVVDKRFRFERVAPDTLLWDVDFIGSDFNESPWIGRDGLIDVAEAVSNGWLDPEEDDLTKFTGDKRSHLDKLGSQEEDGRDNAAGEGMVNFTEVFYWDYLFNPDQQYYKAIHHLVWIDGKDEPVVNEPWKGQQFFDEGRRYVGACKFPIQVCTINYLTNEAIPPSDSAVARPMVNELNKTRQQFREQRDHSKPIRWYNPDRIDSDIQTLLMQGDWNGMIPIQGGGERAIGEVARSNYPRENLEIDRAIKGDLMETWSIGPNQMGTLASGERTAHEAGITEGHFNARIGQERARVVEFVLNLADVMAGLVCLYDDDYILPEAEMNPETGETPPPMWDRKAISHELAFTLRGDATVLMTAEQRRQRALELINLGGKSGYVNPLALWEEVVACSGFDPRKIVQQPQPSGPEPPSVSYRFSGAADLINPVVYAILKKTGQAPTPEELMAAIKDLNMVLAKEPEMMVASATGDASLGTAESTEAGGEAPVNMPAPPMRDDRPDWQAADRVDSRRDASQA